MGRDPDRRQGKNRRVNFNSHARVGRDKSLSKGFSRSQAFQLTRPRGARPSNLSINCASVIFQLTRPRGARPRTKSPFGVVATYFNSHARVGRDIFSGCNDYIFHISTHTPAWGATFLLWQEYHMG